MDFCLVCMPYAELQRPSPAVGILHAILERDGLSTRSFYANLMFAEELTKEQWKTVMHSRTHDGLADWTFAHVAFPDYDVEFDDYLDMYRERHWVNRQLSREHFGGIVAAIRERAEDFTTRLAEQILDQRPRMVGCSSTLVQHVPSLALLRRVHDLAPDVVTLLGGANCETVMGRTNHQSFPWVDYVVSGEADEIIAPLARQILAHGRDVAPADVPDGVFVPQHREIGYPRRDVPEGFDDAPRAMIDSMAGLPTPNYDDYFQTLESLPVMSQVIVPGLSLETSRGCWFGEGDVCTFCGLNAEGTRYRSRPVDEVLTDLETLSSRHGLDNVELVDNILDMRYFNSLVPALKELGAPYRMFYETKANLKRSHVQALREAGVVWIQPGLESVHSGFLRLMKKGCESWTNIQLLRWAQEFGIRIQWFVLRDFPGEDEAWYGEMAERVPLLVHLQPPGNLLPILYTRYSQYHEMAEQFGLSLRPSEPYKFIYPLPEETIGELIYFFDDLATETRTQSPLLTALTDTEGKGRMRAEVAAWIESSRDAAPPRLDMAVSDESIEIVDTRPIAVAPSHTLAGLHRELYLACDEGRTRRWLHTAFDKQGVAAGAVDEALQELIDAKLMLDADGRVVALAVATSRWALCDKMDYPGGCVDFKRLVAEAVPA